MIRFVGQNLSLLRPYGSQAQLLMWTGMQYYHQVTAKDIIHVAVEQLFKRDAIDDSNASKDWGWKADYDIDSMTKHMLECLGAQRLAAGLPSLFKPLSAGSSTNTNTSTSSVKQDSTEDSL